MSADRVAEARAAFDAAFAAPPATAAQERVRLIALRAGGDAFGLRLEELSGLHERRRVVALPSRAAGVLGVVGLRGRMVPVFSLARLLGYPGEREPRWLVAVNGGREPIALAFEHLDGYREVSCSELLAPGPAAARAHVREVARIAGGLVPIVQIASILATLTKEP